MASRIRDDLESLKARAARPLASGVGQAAFAAEIVDGGVEDDDGQKFYLVSQLVLYGEEVVGGDFAYSAIQGGDKAFACNLGKGKPKAGDLVLVFSAPNRLVFFA